MESAARGENEGTNSIVVKTEIADEYTYIGGRIRSCRLGKDTVVHENSGMASFIRCVFSSTHACLPQTPRIPRIAKNVVLFVFLYSCITLALPVTKQYW